MNSIGMSSLEEWSVLKGNTIDRRNEEVFIHKVFSQVAVNSPNHAAIIDEDELGEKKILTFSQLEARTNQLARVLTKLCRRSSSNSFDAIVAISMQPTNRLPTLLLATLKAGMAYLPLDPEFPAPRIKHILTEAEPLILVAEEGADMTIYEGTPVVTYEKLLEEASNESKKPLNLDACSNLAIVLYTSGSTGVPKGARLLHDGLMNRFRFQWKVWPYSPTEERCIFKTVVTFLDSALEIWGPLLQGRCIVVVARNVTKDPQRLTQVLEQHKIERITVVPSLLRNLLMYLDMEKKKTLLTSVRLWICSGEILEVSLARQFLSIFHSDEHVLANYYGSTEVVADVTYYCINRLGQLEGLDKVPIGKPVDNVIVYLVDKKMRLVPRGEVGELVCAGRYLAAGYVKGRDAHCFLDNPYDSDPEYSRIYRTGDYARIVGDVLIFEGRMDTQIKVRGHRVDLAEVEKAVLASPGVDKAVVLSYKPGKLSQALISFVTSKNDTHISGVEIESHLRGVLPSYMIPQVIVVETIPLLVNGKTDRQALLNQYELIRDEEIMVDCNYDNVPSPLLPAAQVLFPTVASVIGRIARPALTIDANFYDLGGNSLNSIETVTRLLDQGYRIGITDFISAKDMGEILRRMRIHSESDTDEPPSDDEGRYIFEELNDSHREDVVTMITDSFYVKGDLRKWMIAKASREDYSEFMDQAWDSLVEQGLSFIVKSTSGKSLGVALNKDATDEPKWTVNSNLAVLGEFFEYLEAPILERQLPKGKGQILHGSMIGTESSLTPAENIALVKEMDDHMLRVAREKGFAVIFSTNTSPLTKQLVTDVYKYEVALEYQVNKFVASDGSRPFEKAPDSQTVICSWTKVESFYRNNRTKKVLTNHKMKIPNNVEK